jgi:CHAD domain-containing protein
MMVSMGKARRNAPSPARPSVRRAPSAAAPAPVRVRPRDPASLALRAALADGLARFETAAATLPSVEPATIHQMRVATRRLRSDLRTFARLVDPDWAAALQVELRWLGDTLGALRACDVLAARWHDREPDDAGLRDALLADLDHRRDQARHDVHQALQSPRCRTLLRQLQAAALDPPLSPAACRPCRRVLPRLVRRAWKKLAQCVAALEPDASPEAYHPVRIRAKRLRYAAEAAAPALGRTPARAARTLARRAAALQDHLGAAQDALDAAASIAGFLDQVPTHDPTLCAEARRILDAEHAAARAVIAGFPHAWKPLGRKGPLRRLAT